ncbi:MAG: hypothetical protein JAZ17_09565 [Candidatus Thiodiazotropha endolucinida]|nr:hypothetical protein [Candidatus Thiodiazotropha endolucinida]
MDTKIDDAITVLNNAQAAFDNSSTTELLEISQPWSQELVSFLSISVLVFSGAALVMATILLWRASASPEFVLKTLGIITIVGFSALLLIVGYGKDQLTPIIGLFGAIAGYLLGKDMPSTKPPE